MSNGDDTNNATSNETKVQDEESPHRAEEDAPAQGNQNIQDDENQVDMSRLSDNTRKELMGLEDQITSNALTRGQRRRL